MAFGRPSWKGTITPFPSTIINRFEFNYSGDLATKNNLVITRVDNNTVVYNQEQVTFNYMHTLPINTLTNGIEYKAKIRVGNDSGWSEFSDETVFKCLAYPVITIINLNSVNSSSFNFISTVTQANGDTLSKYEYILYDSNSVMISASTFKLFSTNPNRDHNFAGLLDNTQYKMELKVVMTSGMTYTTGLLDFTVDYVIPQLPSSLILENLEGLGKIQISTNIIRIEADNNDDLFTFLNNEEVDLRNHYITYSSGINILSNFTMKVWCRGLANNVIFLTLYGEYDTDTFKRRIEFKRVGNKIYCTKTYGDIVYVTYQELNLDDGLEKLIWLQQTGGLLDFILSNA